MGSEEWRMGSVARRLIYGAWSWRLGSGARWLGSGAKKLGSILWIRSLNKNLGFLVQEDNNALRGGLNRSPKGNMWSAIPVALLCMIVNWNERKQGSGPEGDKVL